MRLIHQRQIAHSDLGNIAGLKREVVGRHDACTRHEKCTVGEVDLQEKISRPDLVGCASCCLCLCLL